MQRRKGAFSLVASRGQGYISSYVSPDLITPVNSFRMIQLRWDHLENNKAGYALGCGFLRIYKCLQFLSQIQQCGSHICADFKGKQMASCLY